MVPNLVSVCIPSYNHARFLSKAIESALGQSYRPLEVLVTDDGSSDNSLEIARDYAKRFPDLVRVFTHPGGDHRGISATANLGFLNARGEFWSGLPSDDLFSPEKLTEEVDFLRRSPSCGFVYGRARHVDSNGLETGEPWGGNVNAGPDPLIELILRNAIPAMTVMARRSAMEEAGPHVEALLFSDWELWIRMLARRPCGFIDRPLAKQRVHSTNTSVGVTNKLQWTHDQAIFEHLRKEAASKCDSRLAEPRIRSLIELRCAEFRFLLGDSQHAADTLAQALIIDPSLPKDSRLLARWLSLRGHLKSSEAEGTALSAWVLTALEIPNRNKGQIRRYLTASLLRRKFRRPTGRGSFIGRLAAALGGLLLDPGHLRRNHSADNVDGRGG